MKNDKQLNVSNLLRAMPSVDALEIISPDYHSELEAILKDVTPEELAQYNIPMTILTDRNVINLFSTFGIKTIMEFDRENNGYFSNNNFSVARTMHDNFLHYALNYNDENKTVFTKKDSQRDFYTIEEFEESLRRMILNYPAQRVITLNLGTLQNSTFMSHNQDLFLDENAPDELKDKFYKMEITEADLEEHKGEWTEFLRGKKIDLFMKKSGVALTSPMEYYSFYNFLESQMSFEEVIDYIIENKNIISVFRNVLRGTGSDQRLRFDDKVSVDGLQEKMLQTVYELISTCQIPYNPDLPESFKLEHPELFLSEEIPYEFRKKFCSGELELSDLYGKKEYIPELLGKDLSVGFKELFKKLSYLNNQNKNIEYLLEIFTEYGEYCEYFLRSTINFSSSLDEIKASMEQRIEETVMSGKLPYGEDAPKFLKEKHPELFLDENAPEELKSRFYTKFEDSSDRKALTLEELVSNEEFRPFLKGKYLGACTDQTLSNLGKLFTEEEIVQMGSLDLEALKLFGSTNITAEKLKRYLDIYPEYFARRELIKYEGFEGREEELDDILSGKVEDANISKLFEVKKEKFRKEIVQSPGFVLYYPEEEISKFDFSEYKDLIKASNFSSAQGYRRDLSEQILSTMYCFLGYGDAKDMLQLPTLSEEELKNLIQSSSEKFFEIYQESYSIEGNLKVTNSLFDKLAPMAPGKKAVFSVYKSLNQKLEEGFYGSLEELITSCLQENNIPVDENKIKAVSTSIIGTHSSVKRDNIRETILNEITTNIHETPENRKILIDILNDVLRRSFLEKESLDSDYVRDVLTKEFSRKKDDGTTFYSPHVTDHLEDLMTLCQKLKTTKFMVDIDKSVVELLKEEKEKIGQGWIRKLLNVPDSVTLEELQTLQQNLYGDSGFAISTMRRIELRDKSERGRQKALDYLRENDQKDILTFGKAETIFSGLNYPYSENFIQFFKLHKDVIISDPKYYTRVQDMNLDFDRIVNDKYVNIRYKNGSFTLSELITALDNITYPGLQPGEMDLDFFARKSGTPVKHFPIAQRIFKELREREYQTVPPEQATIENRKYRGRILRIDDPLHIFIGKIATCCQRLGEGQPGESSMIHSATEKNGSLFLVEELDQNGSVVNYVAQSWTWRNGNRVCFDNIEIPDTLKPMLTASGDYDRIFEAYMLAAQKIIETDTRVMKALLEKGKITQEQYDRLVIREVTAGTGCDDLLCHVSQSLKKDLKNAKTVSPVEEHKIYTGVNTRSLYTDSMNQLILATNPEGDRSHSSDSKIEDIPLKYKKIRETYERKGMEIHQELLERAQNMLKKSGRTDGILLNATSHRIAEVAELLNYSDPVSAAEQFTMYLSENEDWFMLTNETESSIEILDSIIVTDSEKTTRTSEIDKKMSIMEYHQKIYQVLKTAVGKGKSVKLDLGREGKFIDLDKLAQSGEISIDSSGVLADVTVTDLEKLTKRLEKIQEMLEQQRQDRILADSVEVEDDIEK